MFDRGRATSDEMSDYERPPAEIRQYLGGLSDVNQIYTTAISVEWVCLLCTRHAREIEYFRAHVVRQEDGK